MKTLKIKPNKVDRTTASIAEENKLLKTRINELTAKVAHQTAVMKYFDVWQKRKVLDF